MIKTLVFIVLSKYKYHSFKKKLGYLDNIDYQKLIQTFSCGEMILLMDIYNI